MRYAKKQESVILGQENRKLTDNAYREDPDVRFNKNFKAVVINAFEELE